jgi:hypothetical protein
VGFALAAAEDQMAAMLSAVSSAPHIISPRHRRSPVCATAPSAAGAALRRYLFFANSLSISTERELPLMN